MDLPRSFSADRIGGLIWIVFGSAVVYGSWTMDRLQSLGIPPRLRRASFRDCSASASSSSD